MAWLLAPAALAVLVVAGLLLRRWTRGRTVARIVTTLATVLGLGWSAQGMWDAAVNRYGVAVQVASILFVVFEAMMISQMLRAHEYRADRARRARFIRAVWVIAVIMALVVAWAEGAAQAPLRLSVPLLVAFSWYMDLTADDDPDGKLDTSWRWTPREVGLRLGLLRITDADRRDATAAERRYLADRIAKLAFSIEHGSKPVSALTRRPIRLARLKLAADADLLSGVAVRLELARRPITAEETHPVMPPQPVEPVHVPAPEPTPAVEPKPKPLPPPTTDGRLPQGVHISPDGEMLRGGDLARDAVTRMVAELKAGRAMANADLAALYMPPLKERTSEAFGSRARAAVRMNGNTPSTLVG